MEYISAILIEAARVLFILGLPLLGASVCGGFFASLLQGFISMQEPSAVYAGRLCAIVIALYLLTPLILQSFQDLIIIAAKSV